MKLIPLNDEHILHFALRYALGRKTGAPAIVADAVRENMERLRPSTKLQMRREIEDALDCGLAGDNCDLMVWRQLAEDLKK